MIGTLLLHAIIIPAAIFGMRAPHVAAYPSTAAGTDGDALLLLLPLSPANAGSRLIDSSVQRWVPPLPAVRLADLDPPPALRMDSTQPEAVQHAATQVDRIAFIKTCRETYPDERRLNQDLADASLQGARVEIAGGDPARALMALHCLQALGTLGVALVDAAAGS